MEQVPNCFYERPSAGDMGLPPSKKTITQSLALEARNPKPTGPKPKASIAEPQAGVMRLVRGSVPTCARVHVETPSRIYCPQMHHGTLRPQLGPDDQVTGSLLRGFERGTVFREKREAT